MTGRDICTYLSIKYQGEWDKIYKAVMAKETVDPEALEQAINRLDCQVLTICDKGYPDALRHCHKPPFVLYYYGNIGLIKDRHKCIGYVGSREASAYGSKMARTICADLARNDYAIVSGMAKGIDGDAQRGALEANGQIVCVLGSGIDFVYPSSNQDIYEAAKRTGLVISEYPSALPPMKEHFPMRNRIIAALCDGLVVGQASSTRSGTMITAGFALDYNCEVGCVPFRADEGSGCNALLRQGAWLIESADDVMWMVGDAQLGFEGKKTKN